MRPSLGGKNLAAVFLPAQFDVEALELAAAFAAALVARLVDEDAAHGLGGGGKEVAPPWSCTSLCPAFGTYSPHLGPLMSAKKLT
jgi:hypothetical protein